MLQLMSVVFCSPARHCHDIPGLLVLLIYLYTLRGALLLGPIPNHQLDKPCAHYLFSNSKCCTLGALHWIWSIWSISLLRVERAWIQHRRSQQSKMSVPRNKMSGTKDFVEQGGLCYKIRGWIGMRIMNWSLKLEMFVYKCRMCRNIQEDP